MLTQSITIGSNLEFNGFNSLYNVKTISGYTAIGQSLSVESRMIIAGGMEVI